MALVHPFCGNGHAKLAASRRSGCGTVWDVSWLCASRCAPARR